VGGAHARGVGGAYYMPPFGTSAIKATAVVCSRRFVICPAAPCRSEALTSFPQNVLFLLLSGPKLC
jgi:hypothetical protein